MVKCDTRKEYKRLIDEGKNLKLELSLWHENEKPKGYRFKIWGNTNYIEGITHHRCDNCEELFERDVVGICEESNPLGTEYLWTCPNCSTKNLWAKVSALKILKGEL